MQLGLLPIHAVGRSVEPRARLGEYGAGEAHIPGFLTRNSRQAPREVARRRPTLEEAALNEERRNRREIAERRPPTPIPEHAPRAGYDVVDQRAVLDRFQQAFYNDNRNVCLYALFSSTCSNSSFTSAQLVNPHALPTPPNTQSTSARAAAPLPTPLSGPSAASFKINVPIDAAEPFTFSHPVQVKDEEDFPSLSALLRHAKEPALPASATSTTFPASFISRNDSFMSQESSTAFHPDFRHNLGMQEVRMVVDAPSGGQPFAQHSPVPAGPVHPYPGDPRFYVAGGNQGAFIRSTAPSPSTTTFIPRLHHQVANANGVGSSTANVNPGHPYGQPQSEIDVSHQVMENSYKKVMNWQKRLPASFDDEEEEGDDGYDDDDDDY